MGEIELIKDGLKWLQSQKHVIRGLQASMSCLREKAAAFIDSYGPVFRSFVSHLGGFLLLVLIQWKESVVRGTGSLLSLDSAAFFVIIWSCFLSLTSTTCLIYVFLMLGAAGSTVRYLGCTSGLFIVGLVGISLLSLYGNLWIAGMLSIIGGYLFSLTHARLVVLMSTAYAIYCAKVQAGLFGVFLSLNLAFLSNDLMTYVLEGYEGTGDFSYSSGEHEPSTHVEDFINESEFSTENCEEDKESSSCKLFQKVPEASKPVQIPKVVSTSKIVKPDSGSLDEIKRILNSVNHYEALGLPKTKSIDQALLRKEYRKKAVLVHPDKNMGIPMASESFKKLQCAYEVLSDASKRRIYDEQLRDASSSHQSTVRAGTRPDGVDYRSEESRRIHCTKCGNFHIWICTNRMKAKARWCQDCRQFHQARDGDGWVEVDNASALTTDKVDIPRAFVCAESKIFDVSEWAICQGMACKPNTHKPTFHVNMVGTERKAPRNKSDYRFMWDLDAEMTDENTDEEFDVWLQQALAAGLFSDLTETSSRRKKWSSIINPKLRKQWKKVL